MSTEDAPRSDSRRSQIIEQATLLFAAGGYERTSMRDIAAAVGMLPGSVYYHFASKEALLADVYAIAINNAIASVQQAVAEHSDPWDRLEAASIAHLSTLVGGGSIGAVVADAPHRPTAASAALIGQRDRYEAVFRDLIDELDLPQTISSSHFRLALLGALNWALTWFKQDRDTPEMVARSLFAVFRANQTKGN